MRQHVVVFVVRRAGAAVRLGRLAGLRRLVTALNADGLLAGRLTSTVSRETANGTPLLLLYRAIAQHASTLDEVEWLLRGARRTIGNNLTVVSAQPTPRSFEFTMSWSACRRGRAGGRHQPLPAPRHDRASRGLGGAKLGATWLAWAGQLGGGRHGIAEAQSALTDCCPTESRTRSGST